MQSIDYTRYVDTNIGTIGHLLQATVPTVQSPHGAAQLEPVFRAHKKGREGDLGKNEYTTLNSDMIKKMGETIPIPVKNDGTFDLEMQKELAAKYEQIENIKGSLASQVQSLLDITVS